MSIEELADHLAQAIAAGYGARAVVIKVAGNEAPVVSDGLIFEDDVAHFEISADS